MTEPVQRAICNYEGTSYRADFWDGHGREYEDLAERVAISKLLPARGQRIVELGAGFGRLADLYGGYEQVVLVDYAKSGLREAQVHLGKSGRFLFVAADLYHLPLAPGVCDTAVTVRVLHHMVDVPGALHAIASVLRPGGTYVLEYANKRNLKAITRFWLGRQRWSPFNPEPVEFVELNFDFHPRWMAQKLAQTGFSIEAGRAVSHFRQAWLKRTVPARVLAGLDGAIQVPSAAWKLAPSVFLRCQRTSSSASPSDAPADRRAAGIFQCPQCGGRQWEETPEALTCGQCGAVWGIDDGIYDFKAPRHKG